MRCGCRKQCARVPIFSLFSQARTKLPTSGWCSMLRSDHNRSSSFIPPPRRKKSVETSRSQDFWRSKLKVSAEFVWTFLHINDALLPLRGNDVPGPFGRHFYASSAHSLDYIGALEHLPESGKKFFIVPNQNTINARLEFRHTHWLVALGTTQFFHAPALAELRIG